MGEDCGITFMARNKKTDCNHSHGVYVKWSDNAMSTKTNSMNHTRVTRFLNWIERIGNKLPDPFMLFITLAGLTIILSWVISLFDVSFIMPGEDKEVVIKN